MRARFTPALLVGAMLAVVASGCSPDLDTRGNIPLAEVVEGIKPGKQSREAVTEMLGSPSTITLFGDEVWYYIGKRTETIAFFEPDVLEQHVLEIRFDKKGVVKAIRNHNVDNARDVDLVDRVTPTKVKELGFLEQIIGNVGRFNNPNQIDN